jgi:hypothetical protein
MVAPFIPNQRLGFEFLQMVAHGVERQPQPARQLLRGEALGSLELDEDGAPHTPGSYGKDGVSAGCLPGEFH